jgi:antitoxin component YwqK of YwqJK toxin-antitoxin module
VRRNGNYKNGKKNGEFESYTQSGQIEERGSYVDGNQDGMHITYHYHSSGRLLSESKSNWKNGKKVE